MHKIFYLAALFSSSCCFCQGSFIVPIEDARNIAQAYYPDKRLLSSDEGQTIPDKNGVPAIYYFNFKGGGSLMISADLQHEPVLAEIEKGSIVNGNIPGGFLQWIVVTIENIELIREEKIENRGRAFEAWINLFEQIAFSSPALLKTINQQLPQTDCLPGNHRKQVKGPLLQTEWGQGCGYNESLPPSACNSSCDDPLRPMTGCIGTAVAQVCKYFETPLNFNYSSMPLYWGDKEIQRLMRLTAFAVQTSFGCFSSSAFFSSIAPALKGPLKYSSAHSSSYSNGSIQKIKEEIENARPLILGGCAVKNSFLWWSSYENCHAWICDGIKILQTNCASYSLLHMNWGWNETGVNNNFNGWFSFNNWEVDGRKFQYMKELITDIKP